MIVVEAESNARRAQAQAFEAACWILMQVTQKTEKP